MFSYPTTNKELAGWREHCRGVALVLSPVLILRVVNNYLDGMGLIGDPPSSIVGGGYNEYVGITVDQQEFVDSVEQVGVLEERSDVYCMSGYRVLAVVVVAVAVGVVVVVGVAVVVAVSYTHLTLPTKA